MLFTVNIILFNQCESTNNFQDTHSFVETNHYYINSIYEIDSIYFLNVDFIEVLTGDSAIVIAKNRGQAEYEISEQGDTTWFVANDYFIFNEKTDSVKIPIDENCKIVIYISDETTNF
ncbi:MAG: hypothetical protein N3D80_10655 [Ignavibacterium album]|uniref:hypothetical protein n=1 Tax=Ignavibacterium album TaxID=591197 RepID=UPI0026EF9F52|nr:hypothetical protein [Ignavibacterium album]MCX8106317.1 hypothetical protein [Ignavibacterium album]